MSVSRQERGSQMSRCEHTSQTEQTVAQDGGPLPLSKRLLLPLSKRLLLLPLLLKRLRLLSKRLLLRRLTLIELRTTVGELLLQVGAVTREYLCGLPSVDMVSEIEYHARCKSQE